jgi:hypothetical protein
MQLVRLHYFPFGVLNILTGEWKLSRIHKVVVDLSLDFELKIDSTQYPVPHVQILFKLC